MQEISQGRVPAELQGDKPGELDVSIEDKRSEQYTPPPPPAYTAFGGSGQALSSIAPGSPTENIIVASAVRDWATAHTGAAVRVQVKLPGGKRTVLTVPGNCPVGALCGKIVLAQPSLQAFQLLTGFPPQPMQVDLELSVTDAGLAGGTLQVKEV